MISLPPGTGSIHLLPSGQFPELSFCYPLKIISPLPSQSTRRGLRVVYILSYGGGLVSGDRVWIDFVIHGGATLVVLTQGTTKVFKRRPRGRLAAVGPPPRPSITASAFSQPSPPLAKAASDRPDTTIQTFIGSLKPGAELYLLPSPTACFSRSRFTQRQRFDLPECGTASLVVLDWFTCGREKSTAQPGLAKVGIQAGVETGERWEAERLEFFAEVWWGGVRGVGERIVLEDERKDVADEVRGRDKEAPVTTTGVVSDTPTPPPSPPGSTTYAASLRPYTIYLTLLLTGPKVQSIITHLLHLQASEPKLILPLARPPDLLWSVSLLEDRGVPGMGRTVLVRACAVDGEALRLWVLQTMQEGMGELVGEEVWERAMG